ncbi:efflux RND transporter periplasmic adaptor subunit [Leptolyngbya sp. BC1307]|uniref:efflux RND transporter periplasmic adaptor subunit n=1 Tax=Leptolyngbya sp. BC1307 TaxID=2029589 RepID=UPI000EFBB24E|nr:efflux RND transporter periplasmic adaptor subunit [Leptolyngbya sp. BC1307]
MYIIQNSRQSAIQVGLLLPLLWTVSGCNLFPPSSAQPSLGQRGRPEQADGPVAVKTAKAETGSIAGLLTYTGTTRPDQQVMLRSQVSGEVTDLTVDVGDAIARDDLLAQLDGNLQTTSLNQAQAELSARRAETAQAQISISDAQSALVQAEATFDQAQVDASRLRRLADQGGISQQEAEAAELAVTNAQQAVRSAQAQIAAQRQAVAAAADRTDAQQAVLAQTQRQLSYAGLRSPLTGFVLSRQVDVGDFVDSGATLLELGDLSSLKVNVEVSELDIGRLSVGQSAQVTFDAFPDEGVTAGRIEQIAPVADATSRLVPVQVSIPNPNGRVGSGLLARVQFSPEQAARVVVPESALALGEEGSTVFVIEGEGEQAKAVARPVRTGTSGQDRVEILSGLSAGEAFVVQSDRPLTSGQAIRLSILSE